jgi:ABC-type phosphate transport system substrate-binding protein
VVNARGSDSYPICRTTWAICYVKQPADKATTLKAFLSWITHEGQAQAAGLYYARVPAELIPKVEDMLNEIKGS